jgi:hypothetical protein
MGRRLLRDEISRDGRRVPERLPETSGDLEEEGFAEIGTDRLGEALRADRAGGLLRERQLRGGTLAEAYREGLDGGIELLRHHGGYYAGIHAAAQEGAEGDVAPQMQGDGLVERSVELSRPRSGEA